MPHTFNSLWDVWNTCVKYRQTFQQRTPGVDHMYGPDGSGLTAAHLSFMAMIRDARSPRYQKPWIVDVPSGVLPRYGVPDGPDGVELVGCTILGACIERGSGHAILGAIMATNEEDLSKSPHIGMAAPYRRPKSVGATAGKPTNALHELAVKVASGARGRTMVVRKMIGGRAELVNEEPYLFVLNTLLDAAGPYVRHNPYQWFTDGVNFSKQGSKRAPHIDDLVESLRTTAKVTPLMSILESYIDPDNKEGRGRYVVKLLLGAGANPNAVDSNGKSAMDYLDPNNPDNQDVINDLKAAAAGFPPPPPPPDPFEKNRTVLQNHIKTEKPSLEKIYPNYNTPNVGLQAESEQAAKFSQYLQTIMPPNTDKSITDAAGILTLYDLVVLISDPGSFVQARFERPLQALGNIYAAVHGQAGDGIWKLCWLHHTDKKENFVPTPREMREFLEGHPPAVGSGDIPLGTELENKIVRTHITVSPWPPAGHNYKRPLIVLVFATGNASGDGSPPDDPSAALRKTMSDALKDATGKRGSAAVIFVFARIGASGTIQTLFDRLNGDSGFISATNTAQRPTKTNLATQTARFDRAKSDNEVVFMLVQLLLKPLTTKWDDVNWPTT